MEENKNSRRGIITKSVGGLYTVRVLSESSESEYIECRARGKFRHDGISPLPGDDVIVLSDENGEVVIDGILPRYSSIIRPPMANLTHLFLLLPSCHPKPDLLTADKITAIAENAEIEIVIVAGKCDLDRESAEHIREIYTTAGYKSFLLSAATGENVEDFKEFVFSEAARLSIEGKPMRAAFAGVSGAGKSTLMTALFPDLSLATGTLSRKTERGKHTTRQVELFVLSDGKNEFYLADTPGFSMLDFTKYNFFPADELADNFREFDDCLGECRYTKCTHTKEEGCAVLQKLGDGKIHRSRHENFVTIYDELKKKPQWKRDKEELTEAGRRKPR